MRSQVYEGRIRHRRSAPWGGLTILGPALMLLFLFTLTGIPPTERRAIESRGDAYREYQRTTSVFVPMPVNGEAQ